MEFTHFDQSGNAQMVDVTEKPETHRVAMAEGRIRMQPATLQLIQQGTVKKGDVLSVARLAGIMAAKNTSQIIPLCHPLMLSSVTLDFEQNEEVGEIIIRCQVHCCGRTGVEMEALTAVSVAALTIYDMCKAVDKGMTVQEIGLVLKSGGRSGEFRRESLGHEYKSKRCEG